MRGSRFAGPLWRFDASGSFNEDASRAVSASPTPYPPHTPAAGPLSRRDRPPVVGGSVAALGERGDRLLRGEGGLVGDDAVRYRRVVDDLLDQIHQLRAEQRTALHDEVDFPGG